MTVLAQAVVPESGAKSAPTAVTARRIAGAGAGARPLPGPADDAHRTFASSTEPCSCGVLKRSDRTWLVEATAHSALARPGALKAHRRHTAS